MAGTKDFADRDRLHVVRTLFSATSIGGRHCYRFLTRLRDAPFLRKPRSLLARSELDRKVLTTGAWATEAVAILGGRLCGNWNLSRWISSGSSGAVWVHRVEQQFPPVSRRQMDIDHLYRGNFLQAVQDVALHHPTTAEELVLTDAPILCVLPSLFCAAEI
jgi:hypothetical protein